MTVEIDGANNIVKTNTISEVTSANGVTVDGLNIKDSKLVTADSVIQTNITDQAINEAKMQISNAPTNGYALTAQSGNTGGMTWAEVSGTTINTNADNRVITGSGTANTLEGEANLTYNGTFLGVGASADLGSGVHVKKADSGGSVLSDNDALVLEGSAGIGMTLLGGHEDEQTIAFGDNGDSDIGFIKYHHNSNTMHFGVNASERMRIDSAGRILANTTSPIDNNAAFSIKELANYPLATKVDATGNTQQIGFNNGNGHIGGITTNGTATAFNTSSDYRLKENISYDFDATTRLKQLKPARFNFKTDTSKIVDGFLAHEVSSIVPESITGNKDAVETKQNVVLNANGTMIYNGVLEEDHIDGKADGSYPSDSTWIAEKEVPVYQSIDQAKLVPLLVKTVLELEARIKTLENA